LAPKSGEALTLPPSKKITHSAKFRKEPYTQKKNAGRGTLPVRGGGGGTGYWQVVLGGLAKDGI